MPFQILVVDDNELFNKSVCKQLARGGYKASGVYTSKGVLPALTKESPDIVLLDMKLPDGDGLSILKKIKKLRNDCEIIMLTHVADTKVAVEAMKAGAFNYILKSKELEELFLTMNNALEKVRLKRNVSDYTTEEINKYGLDNIIVYSESMRKVYELAKKVAREATTCFVLGENGTGKGLLARYIHYESNRRNKPFVDISCCNISDSLMESQIFGHEKGSFTGATEKKIGLFERADGGTVFLDEIGEIQPVIQAKLLKVIEEKTFTRVGGDAPIKVDVRIIAATNRDMEKAVREKKFREDLYYRLNVVPIVTTPLRERREDIIPLAENFIISFSKEFKKDTVTLSDNAKEKLLHYRWFGNVRELRNAIERAVLLCREDSVFAEDLMLDDTSAVLCGSSDNEFCINLDLKKLKDAETEYCYKAFEYFNKNLTKTAKVLGISRDRLRRKLT